MLKVKRNIMINKAGGTSGSGTKNYRVSLPVNMIRGIGVTDEDRSVILEFDGDKITIKKTKNKER